MSHIGWGGEQNTGCGNSPNRRVLKSPKGKAQ